MISTGKVKALSKSKKCTVNDIVLAMVSTSLKEYFKLQKDDSTEIILSIPYTFRILPSNKWDYKFCNKFAAMQVSLTLEENFDKAIKMAQEMAQN